MSRSRRLLKSIEPRPDESIQSIATRLAPLALVTPNEFLRFGLGHAAGFASLPTDTNAIDCLSELGSFSPAEIRSRGISRGNVGFIIYKREVPFDWLSLELRRLAPGALINDGNTPFHRVAWQLNALDCDVDTGEVLVERCPGCAALLRWGKSGSIVTCGNCHFDIRRAPVRYVSVNHLSSARRLYAFILRLGPPLPEPFGTVDDITVCRGMEWLAYFVNSVPFGKHLRPSCQNAAAGLEELYSWPDSFDKVVLERADLLRLRIHGKRSYFASLVDSTERTSDAKLRAILMARASEILQEPRFSALADQERRSRRPRKKRTDDLFDED
jgi:hypothetical protein